MARKSTYEELEQRVKELEKEGDKYKRAKEKLRWLNKDREEIFQALGNGTIIIDPEFNIMDANRVITAATGKSGSNLLGRKCYEIFHGTKQPPENCLAKQIITSGHYSSLEREMEALGSTFLVSCTPVLDDEGHLVIIIHWVTNITERKQAEEALRESEAQKKAILDGITTSISLVNENLDILWANKASSALVNKSTEELMGHKCYEFWGNQKKACDDCPAIKTFRTKRKEQAVRQSLDGKVWDVITEPVFDDKRKVVGVVEIAHDITDKTRLESQLQQAQKMEAIGTLAGGIAHDFNNLLMGIQGRVSLMSLDTDSDHPHSEHLRKIEEVVRRGADLTQQLLGFARKGKYEVKPTDLNDLILKTSQMFGRTWKEIKISCLYQKHIWTVEVDQGQIEQVLLNHYVNAGQAMSKGGELYLQTENFKR